jgi:hypothetical protein
VLPSVPLLVAVLPLALALATGRAQAPLAERVDKALTQARPALLHHLARAEGGLLALVCLAALHDGVRADEAPLSTALERLRKTELDDTYGLSLRLMVLAELPDQTYRQALAEHDAAELQRRQTTGGFSYHAHDGWWDLSNTQYAALGLRAAKALGIEVPLQRWRVLYQALQRMQHEDGGFTYRPGQGRSSTYESMTVAGIAVLEVAAQQLDLDDASRQHHDSRVQRGWDWLAARKQAIGDPKVERCYYFHYGLERAAILSDRQQIGGVDWYAAGAAMLCDEQQRGGGWSGSKEIRDPAQGSTRGHPVDTAFAILFLRRKFQRVQAPITGPRGVPIGMLPTDADEATVRAAAAHDAAQGEAAMPGLLVQLRSDVVARRKAAVLAIFAITGKDFGLHPYRRPQHSEDAIRAAESWWQSRRGAR